MKKFIAVILSILFSTTLYANQQTSDLQAGALQALDGLERIVDMTLYHTKEAKRLTDQNAPLLDICSELGSAVALNFAIRNISYFYPNLHRQIYAPEMVWGLQRCQKNFLGAKNPSSLYGVKPSVAEFNSDIQELEEIKVVLQNFKTLCNSKKTSTGCF